MKMGNRDRRREEVEQFKALVLDAALELMAETKDWNSVSVNKIGAKIRYTPANIYHYFKNKEDIQYHLTLRGQEIIRRFIIDILRTEYKDPKKKILDFIGKFWDFAFEYEEIYVLMHVMKTKDVDHKYIFTTRAIFFDIIKEVYPKLSDESELNTLYESFFSLFHGYTTLTLNDKLLDATEFKINSNNENCKQAMLNSFKVLLLGYEKQFENY